MMGKLQDPPYSAVSLAAPPSSGLYAFRPLDQEQIAEDALAIILLCALRHEDDIAGASTSAANHGDSNAAASLAGALVGARVGFNESAGRLVAPLELVDVIPELADDLHTDCSMSEWGDYKPNGEDTWRRRFCRQPRCHRSVPFPRIACAQ